MLNKTTNCVSLFVIVLLCKFYMVLFVSRFEIFVLLQ